MAGALHDNGNVLVGTAGENFQKTMAAAKGELDRKHQMFEGLVKPLSSGYEKLNPQIEQLAAQMQSVTAETVKLSSALSDSRQVGQWGEICSPTPPPSCSSARRTAWRSGTSSTSAPDARQAERCGRAATLHAVSGPVIRGAG